MTPRVKGTQDVLDVRAYNKLISLLRDHLKQYTFYEIQTPILEHTQLFQRSLGVGTDVVSKEMYYATTAESSEQTLCLRPEATASMMRAYVTNKITQTPWKVFSHGPMFRHERPQKGRYRQFHQATLEMINADGVGYDAELIALLERFFCDVLDLKRYALHLNFLGSPHDRATYAEALNAYLDEQEPLPQAIAERRHQSLLRIFDLKDPACQKVLADAPRITDYLGAESQRQWDALRNCLDQLGVSFTHNPRLVRGLDYYNNTVFEFTSPDLGSQAAFCGGGRYDFLSQTLGEKQAIPSLGAGIGLERLIMLCMEHDPNLLIDEEPNQYAIIPCSQEQTCLALMVSQMLRNTKYATTVYYEDSSVKSKLRRAHKNGMRCCILLGDEEQAAHTATIKDMQTGEQTNVRQNELPTVLARLETTT